MSVAVEAYEAGFVNGFVAAVESIHDQMFALQRDDFGKVSLLDVLEIIDSHLKKERLQ
jgi:hypothetical protein